MPVSFPLLATISADECSRNTADTIDVVGQPLPRLSLWLREELVTALDLEQRYGQACSDLWLS
jgi:hypothetical protein